MEDHLLGQSENTVQTIKVIHEDHDFNELGPENIVKPTDEPTTTICNNEWGHSGFCYRKTANMLMTNNKAKLNSPVDTTRDDIYSQFFKGFCPMDFLETMLVRMNKNIERDLVTLGEFLHWIGLWVLMSSVNGVD